MRVEDLRVEMRDSRARAAATVIWEDCEREPFELFFETEGSYARDLTANANAFLVACFVPAMEHGERRLRIDERICPTLKTGVDTAMGWLHQWYGAESTPLVVESRPGTPPWRPREGRRMGLFLSGGLDSLATLRQNRLDFPLDHPQSIRDCFFVHGFDIGGTEHGGNEEETRALASATVRTIAADAQVDLIPVSTNLRLLDDDVRFWIYKFFGAGVCSVAHAFSSRLSGVLIANSLDIPMMEPFGSHPLLDPNYSSADLAITHYGIHLSRLEKAQLIADWPAALDNLRVCTMNPPGELNCGRCEKCVRTMLELLAVGRLADTKVFPASDVSAELLDGVQFTRAGVNAVFLEMIPALESLGRHDLIQVIRQKSAAYEKQQRWEEERDWKGMIKKLDRRFLRSGLYKTYERLHRRFF